MKGITQYINEFLVKKHLPKQLGKNFEEYKKWKSKATLKDFIDSDSDQDDKLKRRAVEYIEKVYGEWNYANFAKLYEDFYEIFYNCLSTEVKYNFYNTKERIEYIKKDSFKNLFKNSEKGWGLHKFFIEFLLYCAEKDGLDI